MAEKVLVAMSGGVDSSVAAFLLLEQGYQVAGATFELFDGCTESNTADAKAVCDQLGIEHQVFDYRQIFAERVLDYFVASYATGKTPNPCVACNRAIKFGVFLDDAIRLGFDRISTGHYAGVRIDPVSGCYQLYKSAQQRKDQSYVLYHLSQRQLSRLLLPVEQLEKSEVRAIAARANLPVHSKSDSQDICFVPDGDYVGFIERYTGQLAQPGNYIDETGQVIGRHRGVMHYTIGQRKGLGVSFGVHRFVSALHPTENTVTLSDESVLFAEGLLADDLRLIALPRLEAPLRVEAKIRYAHTPTPAMVYPLGQGRVEVRFDRPQRAVTGGQAVVFYQGETVLGGATIRAAK